jgi:hypothetical protein
MTTSIFAGTLETTLWQLGSLPILFKLLYGSWISSDTLSITLRQLGSRLTLFQYILRHTP